MPIRLPRRPVNRASLHWSSTAWTAGQGRHFSLVSNPAIKSISKGRREAFVCAMMCHAISCLSGPTQELPRFGLCSIPYYPKPPRRSCPCYGGPPNIAGSVLSGRAARTGGPASHISQYHLIVSSGSGMGRSDQSRHRAGAGACQDGGQPRRVSLRKRRHD